MAPKDCAYSRVGMRTERRERTSASVSVRRLRSIYHTVDIGDRGLKRVHRDDMPLAFHPRLYNQAPNVRCPAIRTMCLLQRGGAAVR